MLVWQSGKSSLENDDFDIDWSPGLGSDTIVNSSWSIVTTDGQLTIDTNPAPSYTTTLTKVWLSGGTAGYAYVLRNTVNTAAGDTLVEDVQLQLPPAPGVNDLTTLTNALQWLGQSSDTNNLVARLITAVSTQVQLFLGYNVLRASYTRTFNGHGLRLLFVPDIPLVSVQSLTIDGQSIPAGSWSAGSQQAGFYNDDASIGLIGYCFTRGFQNITSTYTSGRAAVPPDLEQAVLDWMKISWSQQAQIGIGADAKSLAAGDFKIDFGGKGNVTDVNVVPMPSKIYSVLSVYQRNTGF